VGNRRKAAKAAMRRPGPLRAWGAVGCVLVLLVHLGAYGAARASTIGSWQGRTRDDGGRGNGMRLLEQSFVSTALNRPVGISEVGALALRRRLTRALSLSSLQAEGGTVAPSASFLRKH
jgi:hypothetical protein